MKSSLTLKSMGVINLTPDSFSDGGKIRSKSDFLHKLQELGPMDALDFGAESTAPTNSPLTSELEWERLSPYLPFLKTYTGVLSFDTYHTETVEKILRFYKNHHLENKLIWNDVSGKFDESVREFLSASDKFFYVYCHNLAPTRSLSSRHMNYLKNDLSLQDLAEYFLPYKYPRVIFDPGLGFSKTYEQNWMILDHFSELQKHISHPHWLLGISRKSFFRKKYGLQELTPENILLLDELHQKLLFEMKKNLTGEVWIRTHRHWGSLKKSLNY